MSGETVHSEVVSPQGRVFYHRLRKDMHVAPATSISQSLGLSFCSCPLFPNPTPCHPSSTQPPNPAQPPTSHRQHFYPSSPLSSLVSPRPPLPLHLPTVLDILVDEPSNEHGHQGIIPGADEHEGQAEAHAQEGECPRQWERNPASELWQGNHWSQDSNSKTHKGQGLGRTWRLCPSLEELTPSSP